MDLVQRIEVATGKETVDLLLKNAQLINVFSGSIHDAHIAVHQGIIVGFGDYDATTTVDLKGRYVAPGFIDGHVHLESSMLDIPEFARNVLPLGTIAVVTDPHEIANVLGLEGIRYILDVSENLPLRVFVMFPSCVPATPFETSGAELTHTDMEPFKDHPRILGLAEMMNFPGLIYGDPEILKKIEVFRDKVKDGHAPGLTGKDLCGYVIAGIGSDHECTTLEEAREKLQKGMRIMIREGSAAKNLETLLPLLKDHDSRNCFFVTDDLDPHDILEKGHINNVVKSAIRRGLHPVKAIQMATINTASYFGIKGLGAVLPGYSADLLVLEDLTEMSIAEVYSRGDKIAERGALAVPWQASDKPKSLGTINVAWEKIGSLVIEAHGKDVNIIGVVPDQIITRKIVEPAHVENGCVVSDTSTDTLKIAVIERHKGTGNCAIGLIRGFGLKRGALAGSVAHDSHNIIVVGVEDQDMLLAAREVASTGGGMVVIDEGKVAASLSLPIAGLMSDRPIGDVKENLDKLMEAAQRIGCSLGHPFATLSFMALTPIPEIKITDRGLFDSLNFAYLPLFAD
jgi:adenine deaminase